MNTNTDENHVTIPTWRYQELVRAETERDILLRVAQNPSATSYEASNALRIVFGPYLRGGETDAE